MQLTIFSPDVPDFDEILPRFEVKLAFDSAIVTSTIRVVPLDANPKSIVTLDL